MISVSTERENVLVYEYPRTRNRYECFIIISIIVSDENMRPTQIMSIRQLNKIR